MGIWVIKMPATELPTNTKAEKGYSGFSSNRPDSRRAVTPLLCAAYHFATQK